MPEYVFDVDGARLDKTKAQKLSKQNKSPHCPGYNDATQTFQKLKYCWKYAFSRRCSMRSSESY